MVISNGVKATPELSNSVYPPSQSPTLQSYGDGAKATGSTRGRRRPQPDFGVGRCPSSAVADTATEDGNAKRVSAKAAYFAVVAYGYEG